VKQVVLGMLPRSVGQPRATCYLTRETVVSRCGATGYIGWATTYPVVLAQLNLDIRIFNPTNLATIQLFGGILGKEEAIVCF
jgi:hypothetical protein